MDFLSHYLSVASTKFNHHLCLVVKCAFCFFMINSTKAILRKRRKKSWKIDSWKLEQSTSRSLDFYPGNKVLKFSSVIEQLWRRKNEVEGNIKCYFLSFQAKITVSGKLPLLNFKRYAFMKHLLFDYNFWINSTRETKPNLMRIID